jgi:hypothetical protein
MPPVTRIKLAAGTPQFLDGASKRGLDLAVLRERGVIAVSQIIADTMNEMGLKLPQPRVDIADIRRKYHAAEREEKPESETQTASS